VSLIGACETSDARAAADDPGVAPALEARDPEASRTRPSVHIDSIFPIDEEIRRFRATIDTQPVELGGGAAASVNELVAWFRAALERSDTAGLRSLVIDRAEFAYLYYPHTAYTREPYELAPGLVWFQMQQNGEKGILRALRLYGGTTGILGEHACEPEPVAEGPNRLWQECTVAVRSGDDIDSKRVFGSVLERDGRFKFVSYANDL
jgi:hypothetical protein